MKRMTYTLWDKLDGYISNETCECCNKKYLATRPNDPAHEPPISLCAECNGGWAI